MNGARKEGEGEVEQRREDTLFECRQGQDQREGFWVDDPQPLCN